MIILFSVIANAKGRNALSLKLPLERRRRCSSEKFKGFRCAEVS